MIPPRFQKAEYSDVPETIRAKFDKIRETRKGLYIHGPVGTGKTHIAYALKKHWDEQNPYKHASFRNTPELLQSTKDDFDRENYDKRRAMETLKETSNLIILDDIGTEQATGWVLDQLYLLINKRYIEMLPMVFTSNLSIEEVGRTLGDRIASRIVEMCDIIELTGKDKRMPK